MPYSLERRLKLCQEENGMSVIIVVGAQRGDEGKARVVDWLARDADLVARFNGGDNAGHTVVAEGLTLKLHLVPAGILHPTVVGLIGAGVHGATHIQAAGQ